MKWLMKHKNPSVCVCLCLASPSNKELAPFNAVSARAWNRSGSAGVIFSITDKRSPSLLLVPPVCSLPSPSSLSPTVTPLISQNPLLLVYICTFAFKCTRSLCHSQNVHTSVAAGTSSLPLPYSLLSSTCREDRIVCIGFLWQQRDIRSWLGLRWCKSVGTAAKVRSRWV